MLIALNELDKYEEIVDDVLWEQWLNSSSWTKLWDKMG